MSAQLRIHRVSAAAKAEPMVYVKTEAGRAALALPRGGLEVRERQVVLLCTGERDHAALEQVFGPAVESVLQRLLERGLIQAVPRKSPSEALTPDFSVTLPPLDFAAATSANQSGFEAAQPSADPWQAARVEAARLLIELGGAETLQLRRDFAGVRQPEGVKNFAVRAIALAERRWGAERAADRAIRIGDPLSSQARASLLQGLSGHAGSAVQDALQALWASAEAA